MNTKEAIQQAIEALESYAQEQQESESGAWRVCCTTLTDQPHKDYCKCNSALKSLRAALTAQREPLTDTDIFDVRDSLAGTDYGILEFARAIEAVLRGTWGDQMTDHKQVMQQALDVLLSCRTFHQDNWSSEETTKPNVRNAIKSLREVLAEPQALAEQEPVAWSPIETAPKGEIEILLMSAKGRIANGMWVTVNADKGYWAWPYVNVEPVKWMPLPCHKAEQQEPYNLKRIAWELERTAVGDGFYGNALRVAKDMPGITPKDRSVLDRYAAGMQTGTDHVHLQWLARWLYDKDKRAAAPQPTKREPLTAEAIRAAGGIVHGDGNVFFTHIDMLNKAIGIKP